MNTRNVMTRALIATFALFVGSQAFAARTTMFLHGDGLGSVVAATNEAGQVLWRKDYAPFGEQIDTTPDTERLSFTGKPHDDLTGLTYFGGRNFDPELGRFVSVDPVAFIESNTMSFNRYLYVNNNPYKYVDPDGELLNFAAKFILDVAINVAVNYITTGEMNVGGALKDSALGIFNPIPGGKAAAKLAMHARKVDKVTPDAASLKSGGRFGDLKPGTDQVGHHVPQNAHIKTTGLSRNDGPAVLVSKADHEKTRTFAGRGKGTMRQDGGLSSRDRMAKDIRDLRKVSGSKYNQGSLEAIKYAKTLDQFKK